MIGEKHGHQALLGTTFIAQAAGFWSTSGKDSTNLEDMTAADIKGWMTLQQVMDGLQFSKEDWYAAGSIPLDVPITSKRSLVTRHSLSITL